MTELSSELKKAEFCIHRKHCHHNVSAEMFYGVCDNVIASSVVASFLEAARKEFLGYVDEIGVKAKGFNQVQVLAVVSALKKKHEQVYGREGK